jgi:phage gpG-like protein
MASRARLVALRLDGQQYSAANGVKVLENNLTATVNTGVRKLREPMQKTLQAVYNALKERHGSRWPSSPLFGGNPGGRRLFARSGGGLKSIKESISTRYDGQMGVVGTISTGTMTIHETGGVTKARGKYLAIPTVYALTSRGNPKQPVGRWRNTFFRETKNGNLFLFRRIKGSNAVTPLYLMRKSVKIKARLGLKQTLDKFSPYFAREAEAAFAEAMRR